MVKALPPEEEREKLKAVVQEQTAPKEEERVPLQPRESSWLEALLSFVGNLIRGDAASLTQQHSPTESYTSAGYEVSPQPREVRSYMPGPVGTLAFAKDKVVESAQQWRKEELKEKVRNTWDAQKNTSVPVAKSLEDAELVPTHPPQIRITDGVTQMENGYRDANGIMRNRTAYSKCDAGVEVIIGGKTCKIVVGMDLDERESGAGDGTHSFNLVTFNPTLNKWESVFPGDFKNKGDQIAVDNLLKTIKYDASEFRQTLPPNFLAPDKEMLGGMHLQGNERSIRINPEVSMRLAEAVTISFSPEAIRKGHESKLELNAFVKEVSGTTPKTPLSQGEIVAPGTGWITLGEVNVNGKLFTVQHNPDGQQQDRSAFRLVSKDDAGNDLIIERLGKNSTHLQQSEHRKELTAFLDALEKDGGDRGNPTLKGMLGHQSGYNRTIVHDMDLAAQPGNKSYMINPDAKIAIGLLADHYLPTQSQGQSTSKALAFNGVAVGKVTGDFKIAYNSQVADGQMVSLSEFQSGVSEMRSRNTAGLTDFAKNALKKKAHDQTFGELNGILAKVAPSGSYRTEEWSTDNPLNGFSASQFVSDKIQVLQIDTGKGTKTYAFVRLAEIPGKYNTDQYEVLGYAKFSPDGKSPEVVTAQEMQIKGPALVNQVKMHDLAHGEKQTAQANGLQIKVASVGVLPHMVGAQSVPGQGQQNQAYLG